MNLCQIGALAVAFLPNFLPRTDHRVVVEVDAPGTMAYRAALGTVANVQKAFAGESLEIEVVCLGGGIDLVLSHDNPLLETVMKLQKNGVRFAACNNTMVGRHIGKDRIFSFVTVVDAGAAEIIRKQEAGWSYLHR